MGVWHRIEIYAQVSTTSSSQDGAYKLWFDGEPVVDYTNVNFLERPFTMILLAHIWDAVDPQVVNDFQAYDHVHISTIQ